jgi:hypothetical protein
MTVLWAVVCCVNACFCDSITLTASVLHDISHGRQDETRELLYHNKRAWLHHVRLNFTPQLSWMWRESGHDVAMLVCCGTEALGSHPVIGKEESEFRMVLHYNMRTVLRNGNKFPEKMSYRQTLVAKWRRKRNDLQNLCWTLRGYVKFTMLE